MMMKKRTKKTRKVMKRKKKNRSLSFPRRLRWACGLHVFKRVPKE